MGAARTSLSWAGALFLAFNALLLVLPGMAKAEATNSIEDISYSALPGDRVQVTITLAHDTSEPRSFTTDHPARIAMDFANTSIGAAAKATSIGVGAIQGIRAAEAGGRTRLVFNLVQLVPFSTRVQGNKVQVILAGSPVTATAGGDMPSPAEQAADMVPAAATAPAPAVATAGKSIKNIDFRRGDHGEGRIIVTLSDPSTPIDMRSVGGKIVVDFINTALPKALSERLDVTDFATPVKFVETVQSDGNARMTVTALGDYDYIGYQTENTYTLEFKPLTKAEVAKRKEKEFKGQRLSLNFQNIQIRAVLQLLADFTGLNVVVSDTVRGSITLRLQNVPWDQALDIILKSKGLAMRQNGNVIMVAPAEEIAAREKLELQARQQITQLAPLRTEFIQINYAKAADIARLLKSQGRNLLSGRGNVSVDPRTNTLLVQETAEKLSEIRDIIKRLDVPVRQVLIESRVVIATNDFSRALGARIGVATVGRPGAGTTVGVTGTGSGTDGMLFSGSTIGGSGGNNPLPATVPSLANRTISSTPIGGAVGGLAIGLLASDYLLDLELQAMQAEGQGEIVSNPRVVTSDQSKATIKQGMEIPYQQATSSGATSVTFKEAVLQLDVTPHITPDDRIQMDLKVTKDTADFSRSVLGVPPLDKREVTTKVLVNNGETIVLGGVYEQTKSGNVSKVPFFGDLPLLGHLFRSDSKTNNKAELLIFVTPKIIKDTSTIH